MLLIIEQSMFSRIVHVVFKHCDLHLNFVPTYMMIHLGLLSMKYRIARDRLNVFGIARYNRGSLQQN